MKEITMITTCEITTIAVVTDEDAVFVETRGNVNDIIRDQMKKDLNADDVNILKNQIFVRYLPDQ